MAYFVAKTLHIDPNIILDEWSNTQLIIAYGYYANEISRRNFEEWKQTDAKIRGKERPEEYAVKFYFDDIVE